MKIQMTIGESSAFPLPATDHMHYVPGMTYRQALIKAIASGVNATELEKKRMPDHADWVVSFADAILAHLDKERGER